MAPLQFMPRIDQRVQRHCAGGPARTKHPDTFGPGLHFSGKSLNVKTVKRAEGPLDVFNVVLQHNLRQANEHHRHRVGSIDPARTCRNEVLRGEELLDPAVASILTRLADMGVVPKRRDNIVGIELVVQAPPGWDRPEFWREVLAWADSRFAHVSHAVVHRDQCHAHVHILVLAVRDGRFAGNAMTSGRNMFRAQRIAFLKHMRDALGLRQDRPIKTLEQLVVSAGKGPKNRAAAERRDQALLKSGTLGRGVDGHGGRRDPASNTHALTPKPTPLLRAAEVLHEPVDTAATTPSPETCTGLVTNAMDPTAWYRVPQSHAHGTVQANSRVLGAQPSWRPQMHWEIVQPLHCMHLSSSTVVRGASEQAEHPPAGCWATTCSDAEVRMGNRSGSSPAEHRTYPGGGDSLPPCPAWLRPYRGRSPYRRAGRTAPAARAVPAGWRYRCAGTWVSGWRRPPGPRRDHHDGAHGGDYRMVRHRQRARHLLTQALARPRHRRPVGVAPHQKGTTATHINHRSPVARRTHSLLR